MKSPHIAPRSSCGVEGVDQITRNATFAINFRDSTIQYFASTIAS
jgi:hypothetical protein